MIRTTLLVLCLVASGCGQLIAQTSRPDRGMFVEPKNEFLDSINTEVGRFEKPAPPAKKKFQMDFSGRRYPASAGEFTSAWHQPPISQGSSGMCWCFSTVSFFESEVYRISQRRLKLSELHTVYWEYVEKAKRFVRERGNSEFGEGSEADAVPRIWKLYGTVPADAYTGLKAGQKFHGHGKMFGEMRDYLTSLKNSHAWDEEAAVRTIRAILDHYLGVPPDTVTVEARPMSPQQYLRDVVKLNLDDYVSFLSFVEKPYYRMTEYEVPDNWWHSKDYHNVPLDAYMQVLKNAIRKGYTMALGGDTSEPGHEGHAGVGVVPSFDIPSAAIDEYARQFRFGNGTSTDDHGIHLVGYKETPEGDWYLIKDSGSGSRNNTHPGYYFYHEDYIKLKILDFMVHRDVAAEILKKFTP